MLCFRAPKKNQKAAAKAAPAKPAAPAKAAAGKIPENILKKQQRDAKLLKHLADQRAAAKAARADARKAAAANATKYAKEYADADKAVVDAKRAAKKAGNFYVDAQAKVALAVRTRG